MLGVFAAGLVAGAVLSATVLWLLSGLTAPLPQPVRYAVVLVAAGVAVLRDLGVVRVPLPQNAWQVPQHVLQHGGMRGPLRFGVELGTGVRTYVSASLPYVLAVALLTAGAGPVAAVLTGVGFGLGRAATPTLRALSPDPAAWDERLRVRSRPLTVVTSLGGATALTLMLLT